MRLFHIITPALFFLFATTLVLAQTPAYYSSIDFSKTGDNLKTQLSTLITNTHVINLPYTATGTTDVWDALSQTDLDPNNSNNVLLVYGFNDADTDVTNDRTRDVNAKCHTSSCVGLWNREHTYARSLRTPNLGTDLAGSDAPRCRPNPFGWFILHYQTKSNSQTIPRHPVEKEIGKTFPFLHDRN